VTAGFETKGDANETRVVINIDDIA
jgi:hypothetical protein